MSELTLNYDRHGVTRQMDVWRSAGEVYLRLREWWPEGGKGVDSTVTYPLADNGTTVEHAGDGWEQYAEKRFERLNSKRFRL